MRAKLILAAGAAIAALGLAGSAGAVNLVTNGNFEAGNTGFGSDYTFDVTPFGQAEYTVDDDPNDGHSSFTSFGDHTSGTGLMMVVNGSDDAGDRVWFQNGISVAPNT